MSGSGTFCPRCGDPVDPAVAAETPRGQCAECYLSALELVDAPEVLEVTVCAHCGAVKRGGEWVDVGARDLTDVAVEEATEAVSVHRQADEFSWSVDPEQVDRNTIVLHADFSATVLGEPVEEKREIRVSIGRGTCKRCGRIAGNAYGSVVQVRGGDRAVTDREADRAVELAHQLAEERSADGDREAFVAEITDSGHGPDIKLSTPGLGRRLANRLRAELGGTVSAAETLVTEDGDGNEVYRVTYALRLPAFRAGDVITVPDREGPVLIEAVHEVLRGVALRTGAAYETPLEAGTVPGAEKLGTRADGSDTTVVSVPDEHAVQVLDPGTQATRTVARPSYFDPAAATVRVFRSDEELYVMPPES